MALETIVVYLLGVATPIFVNWMTGQFGLRHQELNERLNEICSAVQEQADRASEYWAKPNPAAEGGVGQLAGEEGKIVGVDFYIGALVAHLADEYGQIESYVSGEPLFDFSDAVTGGQFGVVNRPGEPARAERIQRAAYALCVAMRKGRREAIFPPRLVGRWLSAPAWRK